MASCFRRFITGQTCKDHEVRNETSMAPRGRAFLDNPAAIHPGDAARHMRHHADVMRDEQAGQAQRVAPLREQVQRPRPHGNIQRGDRLITQQEIRTAGQGARDAEALPPATRYPVGVSAVVQMTLGAASGSMARVTNSRTEGA